MLELEPPLLLTNICHAPIVDERVGRAADEGYDVDCACGGRAAGDGSSSCREFVRRVPSKRAPSRVASGEQEFVHRPLNNVRGRAECHSYSAGQRDFCDLALREWIEGERAGGADRSAAVPSSRNSGHQPANQRQISTDGECKTNELAQKSLVRLPILNDWNIFCACERIRVQRQIADSGVAAHVGSLALVDLAACICVNAHLVEQVARHVRVLSTVQQNAHLVVCGIDAGGARVGRIKPSTVTELI